MNRAFFTYTIICLSLIHANALAQGQDSSEDVWIKVLSNNVLSADESSWEFDWDQMILITHDVVNRQDLSKVYWQDTSKFAKLFGVPYERDLSRCYQFYQRIDSTYELNCKGVSLKKVEEYPPFVTCYSDSNLIVEYLSNGVGIDNIVKLNSCIEPKPIWLRKQDSLFIASYLLAKSGDSSLSGRVESAGYFRDSTKGAKMFLIRQQVFIYEYYDEDWPDFSTLHITYSNVGNEKCKILNKSIYLNGASDSVYKVVKNQLNCEYYFILSRNPLPSLEHGEDCCEQEKLTIVSVRKN